jgi:hypothetical protein
MNATHMTTTEATLLKHLSNFLDEFEGQFDLENSINFTSPEMAHDYLEAARYAKSLALSHLEESRHE